MDSSIKWLFLFIQGFIVQISDNLVLLDDSTGLITVDLTNYRKKVNKDFVPLLGILINK